MIGNEEEKVFIEKAKGLLDRAAENLDGPTRQRLEDIRMKALKAAEKNRSGFFFPYRWMTIGGVATAAIAAVILFFRVQTSINEVPISSIEDFEIIGFHERIDFNQDLDFYRWLATQDGPTAKTVSIYSKRVMA